MFAERKIRTDLVALCLFVLAAFLGIALVTYDPADPTMKLAAPLDQWYRSDQLVYPGNQTTQNACGPWGALIAALLLESVGLGAMFVVVSLVALSILIFSGKEFDAIVLRILGWAAALVGWSTICEITVPWLTMGPVIGSGGYLGALTGGILRIHFAYAGGLVIAASVLLGGLLLCTDYVLVHVGLMLGTMTVAGLSRSRGIWRREKPVSEERKNDTDDLSVSVAGRKIRFVNRNAPSKKPAGEDDASPVAAKIGIANVVPAKLSDPRVSKPVDDDFEDDDEDDELDDEDVDEDSADEEIGDDEPVKPGLLRSTLLRATRGRRRLQASEPTDDHREIVMQQLDEAADQDQATVYELPPLDLLKTADAFPLDEQAREVGRKAKMIEKTFKSFGFNVKVVEIETGPVIAQYEVELESGLRLSKITSLADDLAIALRVPSVRIVAPIPGKNTVGIEVPNERRQLVRLRDIMEETQEKLKEMRIPIFLGKDVSGNPLAVDLSSMPHLLIAGRTGTGKSVCLNAIITSILMTKRPDEVKLLMIDPKMVELSGYRSLPHLMHPVVTDMRKAEAILAWAVDKMEERYELLARAGVRHISGYNQLSQEELFDRLAPETDEERTAIPLHMPYIVIVADEMADLMMTAGKEVEQHIIRLAQKSRAVGIHLILATQKPTVDVITGLIKSNLPARIAFQVASRTDSRVVLDEMGADKLLGNGDMLFLWPGTSTLIRGQGTYLSDEEINQVVAAVSTGEQDFAHELVELKVSSKSADGNEDWRSRDEVYEDAIEVVMREGRGSCSLLQRALGIGYGRAARLIDFMAEDGIVGAYNGSQAREVIMSPADWERMKAGPEGEPSPTDPKRKGKQRVDDPDEKDPPSVKSKKKSGDRRPGSTKVTKSKSPSKRKSSAGLKNLTTAGPLTLHYGGDIEEDEDGEFDVEQAELDAEDVPWNHPKSRPSADDEIDEDDPELGELADEEVAFEEDEEMYEEYED